MRQQYYSIKDVSIEIPTESIQELGQKVQKFWNENAKSCSAYSEVWDQIILEQIIEDFGNNGGKGFFWEEIPSTVSKNGQTMSKSFVFDDKTINFLKKVNFEFERIAKDIVEDIIKN